ncbi:MAG: hypothetical protein AAB452_01850, partial [Patescibacteria group bacterium]
RPNLTRANITNEAKRSPGLAGQATPPDANTRIPSPAPISGGKAISITASSQKGRVLYYNPETGIVTETDFNGSNSVVISPIKLPGFLRTIWSPNKSEVISEFVSSRFRYFNYITKQSVNLGSGVRSIVFSPDGSQIAYFLKNSEGGGIYLASPDNQESKKILNTRFSKVQLLWPGKDLLSLVAHDEQTDRESLFTLTLGGRLTKILDNLSHIETVWSREGENVIISFFDEHDALQTVRYTVATGESREIDTESRASQCVWTAAAQVVLCAVSQTPMSSAALENKSKIAQDMYEIDPKLGTKKLLFSSGSGGSKIQIAELLLSPAEDYLIFTNVFDERLYSFKR